MIRDLRLWGHEIVGQKNHKDSVGGGGGGGGKGENPGQNSSRPY